MRPFQANGNYFRFGCTVVYVCIMDTIVWTRRNAAIGNSRNIFVGI
jgi:hypothetical protein